MPITLPYIPQSITVHMGAPSADAANVTVPFADYVKNVASSEIYPTWEQSAISANILAIVSYALNRVYTEYYRSRGFDFDITSSTAIDQKFIQGRSFFENVSVLADTLFDDYIRRQGFVEPLAAKFCNGTTSTCDGLSQWGSQELAQSGLDSVAILRNYYGSDIEIVVDANIQGIRESYPGEPVQAGDTGRSVSFLQTELNRISQNYPAIQKVTVDGVFGSSTEDALRVFQSIFSLPDDGVAGRATWYRVVQVYVGVLKLSELRSEGLDYSGVSWEYPDAITLGDRGIKVSHLQYMLSVLSIFIEEVPPLDVTGGFDEATLAAVRGFQRFSGLRTTGVVGADTWDEIYSQFAGIEGTVFSDAELFPFLASAPARSIPLLQEQLRDVSQADALPPPGSSGVMSPQLRRTLSAFQRQNSLTPNGSPDGQTLSAVADVYSALRYQYSSRFAQFPRDKLSPGMRDREVHS